MAETRSDLASGSVRPVIEPFLARPRTAGVMADLDRIFFAASATKTFADDVARAAFRERWLGRYLAHDPQLAHLAFAPDGSGAARLVGYIVGSLDDPAQAPRFEDLAYFQSFAAVTARYPAQLHVNLDAQWRGQGLGRDLVDVFIAGARAAGAGGVHVVTSRGMRNIHFYERCGFAEVGCCAWNGRELVMLGRLL